MLYNYVRIINEYISYNIKFILVQFLFEILCLAACLHLISIFIRICSKTCTIYITKNKINNLMNPFHYFVPDVYMLDRQLIHIKAFLTDCVAELKADDEL